jgi:hypothetical protein
LSGNTLSWVYTFEWPFFAGYAIYMWWKLLHEESGEDSKPSSEPAESDDRARQDAEKLAEYNRYLADLHASDRARGD